MQPVVGQSALQYEGLALPEVVAGVVGDPDVESVDGDEVGEEESVGRHGDWRHVTTYYNLTTPLHFLLVMGAVNTWLLQHITSYHNLIGFIMTTLLLTAY